VPPDDELPARLDAVLATIYLIFNAGYSDVRGGLSREAIRLGRTLVTLMPDEPEALGLLALMLLHDSRRDARLGDDGVIVLLEDQDRTRWDAAEVEEGRGLVAAALRRRALRAPISSRPRSPPATPARKVTGHRSFSCTTSSSATSRRR
jgi:RNA polymerase sigma-70 factor, ECF subfamily